MVQLWSTAVEHKEWLKEQV
jgi:hypothetical protein